MWQHGFLRTRQGNLVSQVSQVVAKLVFELFNKGRLIRVVLMSCQCLPYKCFLMISEIIFAAVLN